MEANKIENYSQDGGSELIDKNLNALRLTRKNSHSRLVKRDSNSNPKTKTHTTEVVNTRVEFV